MQEQSPVRLKEIDFLRGCAVVLVIFRHFHWIAPLQQIGWTGVDQFFVLSGFLVSGLLFKEYKETGRIQPGRFLIRRGFKIYPVFYAFIFFTVAYKLATAKPIPTNDLIGELVFLQNYVGHLWNHTWSLAVEEHFYFTLTLLLFLTSAKNLTGNKKFFNRLTFFVAITCLLLRIYQNSIDLNVANNYYSHLRFDSLFWGVFLSFHFHFNREALQQFVINNKRVLQMILPIALGFTLFFDQRDSFFMRTFGFSFLYLGFGSLLLQFMFLRYDIAIKKFKISAAIYSFFSKIGFYSYSIYIIHVMMALIAEQLQQRYQLGNTPAFLLYFGLSVLGGIGIAKTIELPFLQMRDKYFPRQTSAKVV